MHDLKGLWCEINIQDSRLGDNPLYVTLYTMPCFISYYSHKYKQQVEVDNRVSWGIHPRGIITINITEPYYVTKGN